MKEFDSIIYFQLPTMRLDQIFIYIKSLYVISIFWKKPIVLFTWTNSYLKNITLLENSTMGGNAVFLYCVNFCWVRYKGFKRSCSEFICLQSNFIQFWNHVFRYQKSNLYVNFSSSKSICCIFRIMKPLVKIVGAEIFINDKMR